MKEKLAGQWETFETFAATNGNAPFQDLDVYRPGSDTPYLWFVDIDLDGCLIYKYDDDQRILAWFDGDRDDVLKWSVYLPMHMQRYDPTERAVTLLGA